MPVQGFGYLLPRSLALEHNPDAALGVIFDTDAMPEQDSLDGTKLTVILGGHWWDGWNDFPSHEEGLHKAKETLKRHLRIEEDPHAFRVTLQKNCIPQYLVGHNESMAQLSSDLQQIFGTQVRVAGSSYTGVGVNDCIRSARDVVRDLSNGAGRTGLESFEAGRPWTWRKLTTKSTG